MRPAVCSGALPLLLFFEPPTAGAAGQAGDAS